MKHITILFLLFLSLPLFAQKTQEKKVVVIKKEINENGKVTVKETRVDGAEADKVLEEMKKNGEFKNIDIEVMDASGDPNRVRVIKKEISEDITIDSIGVEEDLQVESTVDADGKVTSSYTLTSTKGGKVEVTKWDGTGEAPEAIKKVLAETEVKTIVVDEEGETQNVWIAKDGEQPKLEKKKRQIIFSHDVYGNPLNKASLGVSVDNSGNGAIIKMVAKDSGAEGAGLLIGDTIIQVENEKVSSLDDLLKVLNPYSGGETINIKYMRENKEYTTKATLKSKY